MCLSKRITVTVAQKNQHSSSMMNLFFPLMCWYGNGEKTKAFKSSVGLCRYYIKKSRMLPVSRDIGGLYLSYRDELLVKGKATGALKYSVNTTTPGKRKHVGTPALCVRFNKFGLRNWP